MRKLYYFLLIFCVLLGSCRPKPVQSPIPEQPTGTHTPTASPALTTQPDDLSDTSLSTPPQNSGVKPSFNCSAQIDQGTDTWRLAFISQDKLWLKEPEAEPRQLSDQGNLVSVAFSPDGKQIIYSLRDDIGVPELWVADIGSGNLHPLMQRKYLSQVNSIYSPVMSGDQQFVAFIIEKENGYDLWSARMDGSGTRQLVGSEDLKTFLGSGDSSFYYIDEYTWIPGTHRLIFTSYWQEETQSDPVRWVDAESGEFGIFLPKTKGGLVTFSPDSRWMAVVAKDRLYLASLEDSQSVTEIAIPYMSYGKVRGPVWSSDSSSVYAILPSQDREVSGIDYSVPAPVVVWKLYVDGLAHEQLWSFTGYLGKPHLSPNFDVIAHVGDDSIQFEHITGANYILPLPEDGIGMDFLGWSPDSRHFAYSVGTGSDIGYHAIGDVCGQDSIRLYKEPFVAGLVPGFLGWLDSRRYVYLDYVFSGDWEAHLILSGIDEENVSWDVDINLIAQSFVDYWSPQP